MIKFLEWDSEIFDKKVGIIENPKSIKDISDFNIEKEGYDLIFIKKIMSEYDLKDVTLLKNVSFVDIEVVLKLDIQKIKFSELKDKNRGSIVIESYKSFWEKEMFDFSKEVKFSRFYRDKKIGKEIAERLWKNSLYNHCNGLADVIIIAKDNDYVVGLAIIKKSNFGSYYLYFISVREEYKGKGIGTEIIRYILMDMKEKNKRFLITETQLINREAMNFYIKNFFSISGYKIILHIWRQ